MAFLLTRIGGICHGAAQIPAHGVTTIFSLLEKARGATFARDDVTDGRRDAFSRR